MLHGPCGSRNGPDEVFGRHRMTLPSDAGRRRFHAQTIGAFCKQIGALG